jgi:NAD(P)H-flavin reductase
MLQAALAADVGRVLLLHGARTQDKLLFAAELAALAKERPSQFRFEPTLTQPGNDWSGRRGRVQEHLAPLVEHVERGRVQVYVCGTKTMVDGVRSRLGELGIDPKQVASEAHGD